MRYLPVLALAAAAAATPAGAQGTPRARVYSFDTESARQESEHRAALGVGTTATGTLRDTLGVMITSVTKASPAERAGLEEGNRLSAINGVSLRANAADVEDGEMSGTLTRRLMRELGKVKPGDEVELRVYKEGRTVTMKVKTADSDSLFRRKELRFTTRDDAEDRPVLGFGIGSSGGRRDTLGVLVIAVDDSTPAAKAGLEEGNRIAAINGVNLRVSSEDAGDRYLGSIKAQRLRREITQLKPGSEVTLRVYSNGQFRDVRMKVARAGDLPKQSRRMMMFGDGMGMGIGIGKLAPMSPMPPMPPMPKGRFEVMPRAPMPPMRVEMDDDDEFDSGSFHYELGPQIEAGLRDAAEQIYRMGPQVERALRDLPRRLEEIRLPTIDFDVRVNTDVKRALEIQSRALRDVARMQSVELE